MREADWAVGLSGRTHEEATGVAEQAGEPDESDLVLISRQELAVYRDLLAYLRGQMAAGRSLLEALDGGAVVGEQGPPERLR